MLVAKGKVLKFCEAYRTWWANALVKDNCDLPREGCLWDLDIAVMLCTVGWHLVWKVGTKVVVLDGGGRGSFGEAG